MPEDNAYALKQRIVALEKEREELWSQRDAAFATWQPLVQWDTLRKEKDYYKQLVQQIQKIVSGQSS